MAEIGKINKLTVKRIRDYGAHLDGGESGDILLKYREVPANCQPGDVLDVFLYYDRDDHLRATTRMPYATVDQFAILKVSRNTATGTFMDWGLDDKDLFVPKSMRQQDMEAGSSYLVYIFVDEFTHRITASTKIDKFLSQEPPDYQEGEEVELVIYDQTELGYKALVDRAHGGVIYKNEVFQELHVGQYLPGFIKKVREDHKIDLTLQRLGAKRAEDVSKTIMQTIIKSGGKITITDKSPPEDIYAMFGVSKKTFKKAIGALYKKRLVTIEDGCIRQVRK